jgi:indole-3-glycerol phosphate synthase
VTRVTSTYLDRILAQTARDLDQRRQRMPIHELEELAARQPAPSSLSAALRAPGVQVIAEMKRASPSRGLIAPDAQVAHVAQAYLEGGAAALSVLTDTPFFQGSLEDLRCAAQIAHAWHPPRPVLRKDFVLDPYQVVEARAAGADAVLLIVAACDAPTLLRLLKEVQTWEMEALVEVHDEAELTTALDAGAMIIGINNRDLRTFQVDLATTERLVARIPADRVIVAESGIHGPQDVKRLAQVGVDAVLVGESLMVAADRKAAVEALWQWQLAG